ncbi:MAG: LysR substrate-binding domain-containing protein, partial [Paracoccaceae bacterium]
ITLTAPDALISYYLTPVLTDFASREPSIELNIISNPFGKRLGDGSVDMAILLEKPVIGRHIVKKLGQSAMSSFVKPSTRRPIGLALTGALTN